MLLTHQEPAERLARAEQGACERAALEITPREQYILRGHCRCATLHRFFESAADGAVRRDGAIAVVKDAMSDEVGQRVLESTLLLLQPAVDDHAARGFETGAQHPLIGLAAFVLDPADAESCARGDCQYLLETERHAPFADRFRGALDVGKVVLPGFLPHPYQEARELGAAGAGLREQFRQRRLQQFA